MNFGFFEHLDLFKLNVALKLDNKEKTSTFFGKIISLLIYTALGYLYFTSDMIAKTNPNVINRDVDLDPYPNFFFTADNFKLIFAITDEYNNIIYPDPTICSLIVYGGIYYTQTPDNDQFWEITTHNCTEEDFDRDPALYQNIGVLGAQCFDNETFSIGGSWDEPMISFIDIDVTACVNGTNPNITCQSEELISESINNYYFSVWMMQQNIDANNYKNPVKNKIKTFYNSLDYNFMKVNQIYMNKVDLITNDGLFFDSYSTISSYVIGKQEVDIEALDAGTVYEFYLYAGNEGTIINRNYQKFENVLANIGGTAHILMIVGFLLAKIQNNKNLNQKLINSLYTFSLRNNRSKFNENNEERTRNFKDQENGDFNKQSREFKVNICTYLLALIKPNKYLNATEKEIKNCINLIDKEMDLIKILKKIKEIDKMKRILFDDKQLTLFNLLSKPRLDFYKKIEISRTVSKAEVNSNKISKIYSELSQKSQKTKIDKKFLSMIEEDIKCHSRLGKTIKSLTTQNLSPALKEEESIQMQKAKEVSVCVHFEMDSIQSPNEIDIKAPVGKVKEFKITKQIV